MLLSSDYPVGVGTMVGIPTGSGNHRRGPAVVGDPGISWLLSFSCPPFSHPLAKPSCDPAYTGDYRGQPPSELSRGSQGMA